MHLGKAVLLGGALDELGQGILFRVKGGNPPLISRICPPLKPFILPKTVWAARQ
jgi:hypothetical protein